VCANQIVNGCQTSKSRASGGEGEGRGRDSKVFTIGREIQQPEFGGYDGVNH